VAGDLSLGSILSGVCSSDSGGSSGSGGAYAGPVSTVELVCYTEGSVREGDELTEVGAVPDTRSKVSTDFEVDVEVVAETEVVDDTSLNSPLSTSGLILEDTDTCERNDIPDAALFVTGYEVGEVEESVSLEEVESLFVSINLVVETTPSETESVFRGDPLAEINLSCKASKFKTTLAGIPSGVYATCETDIPVVEELVGFIATEFGVSILILVGFLRERSNADKKSGSNSKKLFHTFFVFS
jgi:hypothetical protein